MDIDDADNNDDNDNDDNEHCTDRQRSVLEMPKAPCACACAHPSDTYTRLRARICCLQTTAVSPFI